MGLEFTVRRNLLVFKIACEPKKTCAGHPVATPKLIRVFHSAPGSLGPFYTSLPDPFTKYTAPEARTITAKSQPLRCHSTSTEPTTLTFFNSPTQIFDFSERCLSTPLIPHPPTSCVPAKMASFLPSCSTPSMTTLEAGNLRREYTFQHLLTT